MNTSSELRNQIITQAQGALTLSVAFIGVSSSLFSTFAETGAATAEELAMKTGLDISYLERWCDAAFAFGFLDEEKGKLELTELGRSFIPDAPGSFMPFAIQSVMSAHVADRATTFMKTGERQKEMMAENPNIIPFFGLMLETMFGEMFEQQILPNLSAYRNVDAKRGLVVDLGCGNGWYLRKIANHFHHLRCIGIDDISENIDQAQKLAQKEDLEHRLTFMVGDIHYLPIDEYADLMTMNRALHHVWGEKETIFDIIKEHLAVGGSAIIWEPNWPQCRADLRNNPARQILAFQNLSEHIQGNHYLRPEQIEAEFHRVGMKTHTYFFASGNETIVVGENTSL
jgi:SAM-dependent methyltransferase